MPPRLRLVKTFSLFAIIVLLIPACGITAEAVEKAATSTPPKCSDCAFESEAMALERLAIVYKNISDNEGWPAWVEGRKIEPGHSDARIPVLREILTVMGDYTAPDEKKLESRRYDDALVSAVKHFQIRHGLKPDGTLGKSTQKALAVPVQIRLAQIAGTIERIRARPQPQEPRFVLVNLPGFILYAIESGKPALTMRVIVGGPKNPTPLFDNDITHVIFNPQWHVPEKIARKEMVPKLAQDPNYFIKAGFVVTQNGQPVDPLHVNPNSGKLTFRQRSGDENALGKIKFNIPDSEDIYLHSTSAPRLFTKDDRALSHGCIRVEKPLELAYFMFEGNENWDEDRVSDAYDGSKEQWAKTQETPVHLVYWTAFVDSAGTAYFYNDIYKMDESTVTAKDDSAITIAAQN